LAKRAAFTQSPVLIYGETGTGKELFAQSIHNASCRAKSPFVAINCAAIPENLLEGILFGTVKGAYTEAVDRPGLFEQASDGTLFLDEINSMSLLLQAKLLRVLQEKKIRRVGGMTDIEVNPRIISSVNMKPLEAIEKGLLRSDLFYRLGVVCLGIPPLRERTDDLPYLIDFFIKKVSTKLAKGHYTAANDLLRVFQSYNWPGNVRQLEHALECAITLISSKETEITIEHIPEYMKVTSTITIKEEPLTRKFNLNPLDSEIEKVEKNKIITVLEDTKGNISLAARLMNISRQSLHYRMKKHQIRVSR
jgi:arginine utilization regulatory protein